MLKYLISILFYFLVYHKQDFYLECDLYNFHLVLFSQKKTKYLVYMDGGRTITEFSRGRTITELFSWIEEHSPWTRPLKRKFGKI